MAEEKGGNLTMLRWSRRKEEKSLFLANTERKTKGIKKGEENFFKKIEKYALFNYAIPTA
jgi:ribosomal protein L7Ae-like RNA K-turn-binding protein